MLVTNDPDLHARVQRLRDHGRPPGDRFFLNDGIAFECKMSAVQAAPGLAQMERIAGLIARKRAVFAWRCAALADSRGLRLNAEPPGVENSAPMVTIASGARYPMDRFALLERLAARGVDTRPFFSALPDIPAFADRPEAVRFPPRPMRGAYAAARGVNLPSGYRVDAGVVTRVAAALRDALGGAEAAA